MRKTLFISLAFLPIFIAGCDNGSFALSSKVPSKLRVLIEREITGNLNEKLIVYAMDFRKEGRTLIFVCPCHITTSLSKKWLNVRVEGDSFKLFLLPDAEYKVEVTYWAPNADNNKKVQFRISR